MANPQPDVFVKIATELAAAIARVNLSAYESRVLWCILIKTYGWSKKTDRISYSQFEEATGMKRWHIANAIKLLITRRMIVRQGEGQIIEYGIQKDYDLWQKGGNTHHKPLPKGVIDESGSTVTQGRNSKDDENRYAPACKPLRPGEASLLKGVTKPLLKGVNTKAIKQLQKHITKEDMPLIVPQWIDKETWSAFLEIRRLKKAAQTDEALRRIVKELENFRAAGQDVNEILNQSIINSWKGVFPLKKGGGNGVNKANSRALPTVYTEPADVRARE